MKLFIALVVCCSSLFGQHTVSLTWTEPATAGAPTSYNILRATTSGGPYTLIASISVTNPGISVTSGSYVDVASATNVLTEGATYFYVVNAANSAGPSPNSTQASATIPFALPATPTGLTATAK